MLSSKSDLNLLLFDPEIERTLRRARLSSSDTGTSNMGDLNRIIVKQMGGASMALENQPVRFPELNDQFASAIPWDAG
ncbi:hypothetical protein PIB30_077784 [Stylosanthes scabra]|uniref:Uncharacterized protein n=1 Tax=Stylosanthes scabra TaxID=79078 RepID=A0ABU6SR06_9FABA|nr:hypothetical protein [Stylosanthes scabra]